MCGAMLSSTSLSLQASSLRLLFISQAASCWQVPGCLRFFCCCCRGIFYDMSGPRHQTSAGDELEKAKTIKQHQTQLPTETPDV